VVSSSSMNLRAPRAAAARRTAPTARTARVVVASASVDKADATPRRCADPSPPFLLPPTHCHSRDEEDRIFLLGTCPCPPADLTPPPVTLLLRRAFLSAAFGALAAASLSTGAAYAISIDEANAA